MSIPTISTWEIVGTPRRPSLADLGGGAFVDDATYPPDPGTMPSAAMENQNEFQVAAVAKVMPACVICVKITAGTPSINKFSAPSGLVITGTFTVTDNGTGDTSVTWPANTFPALTFDSFGGINGATIGQMSVQDIANGIRVRTANAAGVATDLNWTVYLG